MLSSLWKHRYVIAALIFIASPIISLVICSSVLYFVYGSEATLALIYTVTVFIPVCLVCILLGFFVFLLRPEEVDEVEEMLYVLQNEYFIMN